MLKVEEVSRDKNGPTYKVWDDDFNWTPVWYYASSNRPLKLKCQEHEWTKCDHVLSVIKSIGGMSTKDKTAPMEKRFNLEVLNDDDALSTLDYITA